MDSRSKGNTRGTSRKGNIIQTLRGALFLAGVVVAAHLPGPMSTPLLPPATKNHSKPRVGLEVLPPPFPPLQTRPALIFHSRGIKANHWLLLPAFIYGALVSVSGSVWGLGAISAVQGGYAIIISKGLGVLFCAFVVAPCYVAAVATNEATAGVIDERLLGFCFALTALLLQVAGHKTFEKLQPSPNLLHGFLAAPALEFVVLCLECAPSFAAKLLLLGWGMEDVEELFVEAASIRTALEAKLTK
ncbi:hypothetical protein TrST_g669 [Triparma strigata]|uniref:Uncharacterized protein n=1 Tax=Triparma strigata TaxID=1606541 RepID=A0A9W7AVY7_9STRA|nr:hypothetical protein TrST_g669 [Triparma strigata]